VRRTAPPPEDVVFGAADPLPAPLEKAALLVDKPLERTSFDIVRLVRRHTSGLKVGHAGTLDPKATGLLIVLVGKATKLMERFMECPKTYEGVLRMGATTPSYDTETEVDETSDWSHLTREDLEAAREPFLGYITQKPPLYSAVKVEGERLYKRARRGEDAKRPPRQVRIDTFELTDWDGADVSFRVECSKGTYIRSLAHDYGQALGVGAYLRALRRTAIGPYHVRNAWATDALRTALQAANTGSDA
jgi:tRNA pseudouridine55 synthase